MKAGAEDLNRPDFWLTPAELEAQLSQLRVTRGRECGTQEVHRVVVRVPNWLGDAIMALPTLDLVCRRFHDARVSVVAVPRVAPLFHGRPGVAEVLEYPWAPPRGGLREWWRFIQELRRQRFEMGLLLPNSLESALAFGAAGVGCRVGYATDGRGLLLHCAIRGHRRLRRQHQVYRYLGLLRPFGQAVAPDAPRLHVSEAEMEAARELLVNSGRNPARPLVGCAPGASYGPAKQWPPERFGAVAAALGEECGAVTVILGGPGDREAGRQMAAAMQPRPLDFTGRTQLRQALAILAQVRLLLTNDSGLMHAGAALGRPVVAIFGSTDPVTTGPFTPLASVVQRPTDCSPCLKRQCPTDHRCMTAVSVEEVLTQAREWLRRK